MKERPILFSGSMARAIFEGRKTQTRRIVKTDGIDCAGPCGNSDNGGVLFAGRDWSGNSVFLECPYGQPGDRLWVRETWAVPHAFDGHDPRHIPPTDRIHYAATEDRGRLLWRPSIFMPRWASRITLEIVSVRVERLQDISDEDSKAEGIHRIAHGRSGYYYSAFNKEPDPNNWCHPCSAYKELWESINGPGSWGLNPWVWVVEFKEVK